MKLPLRLLILLVLSIAAGFFAGRVFWATRSPDTPPVPAVVAPPAALPDFRLQDLSGAARSITEWSSQALIVNFWATWCAPCRKEMPLLEQVHRERAGRGLNVVGVAIDREEPVRTFIAETGITYPILFGEADAMAAAESFGSAFVGLPLTVVVAPGGEIVKIHTGELDVDDLARIVAVLDRLIAGTLSVAEARTALEKT